MHAVGDMTSLQELLEASASFVVSLPPGPLREQACQRQFASVMRLISVTRLTVMQAVGCNDRINQLHEWTPQQREEMHSAILAASQLAEAETVAARRGLQDYTLIINYMPESLLQTLRAETVDDLTKLETLLMHCISLGMRTPSEPTFQLLTALHVLDTSGIQQLSSTPLGMRYQVLQGVKQTFRKLLARSVQHCQHVHVLPSSPAEFAQTYPQLYAAAFANGHPVNATHCTATLARATAMIPMRNTRGDNTKTGEHVKPQSFQTLHLRPDPHHGQNQSFDNFGFGQAAQLVTGMMQQMQQMAQVQQATLSMLTSIASGSTPVQGPLHLQELPAQLALQAGATRPAASQPVGNSMFGGLVMRTPSLLCLPPPDPVTPPPMTHPPMTPPQARPSQVTPQGIASRSSSSKGVLKSLGEAMQDTEPVETHDDQLPEETDSKKKSVQDATKVMLEAMKGKKKDKDDEKKTRVATVDAKPKAKGKAKAKAKAKVQTCKAKSEAQPKQKQKNMSYAEAMQAFKGSRAEWLSSKQRQECIARMSPAERSQRRFNKKPKV